MTSIDTSEFRVLLQEERSRVEASITHFHDNHAGAMEDEVGELAGRGVDNHPGDMATVTYDRELDEGLEEGAQQTLAQIDRALAKLDDGTYGVCERCGREIGEERLRARPWALLCIDDQRLADRG
jgi:RNA polymerase-binding protein DksA